MALGFGAAKGSAVKDRADAYVMKEGENNIRLLDLCARYVYWIKGENGKDIPMECLSFDRDTEKFTNAEKDWVKEYYPDLKCGKGYVSQIIADGKIYTFNHKAKLLSSILDLVAELGDPADPETGWDVIFTKKKTGPLTINVEYKLKERQCKVRPLSEAERELIKELKPIDEVMPRSTPDQQKAFLDKLKQGDTENIDEEIAEEFEVK